MGVILDAESVDIYEEVDRRARKDHECCGCQSIINRGKIYTVVSGLLCNGEFFRHKICLLCRKAMDFINEKVGTEGFFISFEDMTDDIIEALEYDIGENCEGKGIAYLERLNYNLERKGKTKIDLEKILKKLKRDL